MFTLEDDYGHPFLEVRRWPKNPLMPYAACHLRIVNRYCYFDHAATIMADFLEAHDYTFCRIARVDICLDLVKFDDNTRPRVFMQRYMRGKFAKINQANIHSHGSDTWTGRVWNSVSWGSPTSQVGTKFYNKTLELYDPKTASYGKPYIRQAWFECGMIDNIDRCTLQGKQVEVWRIEFSLRSSVKKWVTIEVDGEAKKLHSIPNTLDRYDSRDKMLALFASLCRHYFRFKRYQMETPKHLCPDRKLFYWNGVNTTYEVGRDKVLSDRKPATILLQLIRKLRLYLECPGDIQSKNSATQLLRQLEAIQLKMEQENPYSRDEAIALQQLLARRLMGDFDTRYEVLLKEISEALKIHPRVLFI